MAALPLLPLNRACHFGTTVRVLEPEAGNGNVSVLELLALNHLVVQHRPAIIFEMGTFDGRTALNMAANSCCDAKVFTIDLPRTEVTNTLLALEPNERRYVEKASSGARIGDHPLRSKIRQLYGDTAKFDFSLWYDQVDFVFVDASHTAHYVENDTRVALKLIGSRPDGLILWHDYGVWRGVTETLDRLQGDEPALSTMSQILGTSLAICAPNSNVFGVAEENADFAAAYWHRYRDVAASDIYGKNGRLGPTGAREHYRRFGATEGRKWGL